MLRFVYKHDKGLAIADFNGNDWVLNTNIACAKKNVTAYSIGTRMFICDMFESAAHNLYHNISELTPHGDIIHINYKAITSFSRVVPLVDRNGTVYLYTYMSTGSITLANCASKATLSWCITEPAISDNARVNLPMFVGDRICVAAGCADRALCPEIDLVKVLLDPKWPRHEYAIGAVDNCTILAYSMYDDKVHVRDVRMGDPFVVNVAPHVVENGDLACEASTASILASNMIASCHDNCVRLIDMRAPMSAYDLPPVPGYHTAYGIVAKFVTYAA